MTLYYQHDDDKSISFNDLTKSMEYYGLYVPIIAYEDAEKAYANKDFAFFKRNFLLAITMNGVTHVLGYKASKKRYEKLYVTPITDPLIAQQHAVITTIS